MFEIMNHIVIVSTAEIRTALTKASIDKLITNLLIQEKNFTPKSTILFIEARAVAGMQHLKACILNSIKGISQKNNISNSLNVEILLYLSGYRQISKAIERCGLSKNTRDIICVQIIQNDLIKKTSDHVFNYEQFLSENNISIKTFQKNVEFVRIADPKTIMFNLEITDENIDAVIAGEDNKISREEALKLLAIEKSALLNLIK